MPVINGRVVALFILYMILVDRLFPGGFCYHTKTGLFPFDFLLNPPKNGYP